MVGQEDPVKFLSAALNDALALLHGFVAPTEVISPKPQSPGSLLQQCLDLCSQHEALAKEPIRTLHHFACTGGSLISKCVAAMPNVQLLSEISPLSTLQDRGARPRFAPTDMATLLRQSTRGTSQTLLIELFLQGLDTIYSDCIYRGQRLVLRDHAHSDFCTGDGATPHPGLRSIVGTKFPVLSVVTVRHPLDSYLSLRVKNWLHFVPATFDEYCRRYIEFLRAHDGLPIIQYEQFVSNPAAIMSEICSHLDLAYSPQFIELFSVFTVTGESGRTGDVIDVRPRRPVDHAVAAEIDQASNYKELIQILGY